MIDIIVFILLLLFVTIWNHKKISQVDTESGYLLANRNTKTFALVATLVMTEFNPSTLVGFAQAGYGAGIWALTLPFVFLVGLSFYTFTVAEKWKSFNGSSVAELFTVRYGPGLGKIASIFLLLAMFGFSANYIKSLQILFSPLFPGVSPKVISLMFVIVILLVTIRGGLISVIQTDILSFLGTMVFIPLLFYFAYKISNPDFATIQNTIKVEDAQKVLPPKFIISLIVLTMFTYIAAPWYGQKIFSAESKSTAFRAVGISSILVFLLYAFPVLGVYFLNLGQISLSSSEMGVSYIVGNLFPPVLKGFGYFILFCAGATTLGGVWSAMVTMIITDLSSSKIDEKEGTERSVILTLFIALLSLVISVTFIDKILDKLILANIPVAALSFGLLGGFYWKKTSRIGVILSLCFGLFWGVFSYLYFGEQGMYTWYWSIYGILGIFGLGIIGSILFPPSEQEVHLRIELEQRMRD